MTYKTILLHLHDSKRAPRLLEAAAPLARAMDAHLIALCVVPPYGVIPAMEGSGTTVTVEEHRDAYRLEMARLKAIFDRETNLQVAKNEWREADAGFGTTVDRIIQHGRACDLVIASQADPTWSYSAHLEEPARLAIEIGRPVVLVPNSGRIKLPPKRVTIAWNGRREAARAVFDTLPLLIKAEEVQVLWVDPERDQPNAGDLPGTELSATLARHGVKCVVSQASAINTDVSGELLRQADAFGSDLLVMGAYGHSRFREFLLGGASRDILASMNRPVLMSH